LARVKGDHLDAFQTDALYATTSIRKTHAVIPYKNILSNRVLLSNWPLCFGASASSGKWEQLLAAAQKEGEVVMIGPTIPDLRQAYTEEFPKDTGIRLLYEGLGPALVSPRIEREAAAGKISADAILGGSVELRTLYPKGLPARLKPILAVPEVIDASKWADGKLDFTDPERQYMLRTVSGVYGGMVINTSKISKSAIKSSRSK